MVLDSPSVLLVFLMVLFGLISKDQSPYFVLFSTLNVLNSLGVLKNTIYMLGAPVNSLAQAHLSSEL